MRDALAAIDAATTELVRLDRVLKKGRPRVQVTLSDETSLAKATALAWFNDHRKNLAQYAVQDDVADLDAGYRTILEWSARATTRTRYLTQLKRLREQVVALRSTLVTSTPQTPATTADSPPDFSSLVPSADMRRILAERWSECSTCISAKAPLAATVMMGGLLEALLLARLNREPDKRPFFSMKASPKDRHGKSKPLDEWTLKDYIAVAHEAGWISTSARDVGAVLRDYRNYIHPQKQLSHNLTVTPSDAALLWEVTKTIARELTS